MSKQIIKQPNGRYCIYSSIIDSITHYDMNADDIINEWVNDAKKEIEERVKGVISKLENNEKPYQQFTKNYNEMLEDIKDVHGKKESNKIKSLIEKL